MPGSILQGVASIVGSDKAADASEKAAELQDKQFQQTRQDLLPFLEFGQSALAPLAQLFGLNLPGDAQGPRNPEFDRIQGQLSSTPKTIGGGSRLVQRGREVFNELGPPKRPNPEFARLQQQLSGVDEFLPAEEGTGDPFDVFFTSPGFEFRRQEGIDALDRSASARGQLLSGAQQKEIINFSQNLASAEFNNFVDRLSSFAGLGQTTGAQIGTLGAQAALAEGRFKQDAGGQRASGLIGAANAFAGRQQQLENTALSIWGFGKGSTGGFP